MKTTGDVFIINIMLLLSICVYSIRFYDRKYHHEDSDDDGYFWVFDQFKNRKIYVCKREVGRSKAFNEEFCIKYFVDLCRTNDEFSGDLGVRAKEKVYRQICRIVVEMIDSEGNIAIFCGRGRTRSPIHMAAYFIVVCCYTTRQARSMLSARYFLQRGDNRGIDRDCRFVHYLDRLERETSEYGEHLLQLKMHCNDKLIIKYRHTH